MVESLESGIKVPLFPVLQKWQNCTYFVSQLEWSDGLSCRHNTHISCIVTDLTHHEPDVCTHEQKQRSVSRLNQRSYFNRTHKSRIQQHSFLIQLIQIIQLAFWCDLLAIRIRQIARTKTNESSATAAGAFNPAAHLSTATTAAAAAATAAKHGSTAR